MFGAQRLINILRVWLKNSWETKLIGNEQIEWYWPIAQHDSSNFGRVFISMRIHSWLRYWKHCWQVCRRTATPTFCGKFRLTCVVIAIFVWSHDYPLLMGTFRVALWRGHRPTQTFATELAIADGRARCQTPNGGME